MTNRALRTFVAAGLISVFASDASAAIAEGQVAPNARIEDAEGRVSELKASRGKAILIVYEDRDSAKQNDALKRELAELARGDRYRARVALVAMADVSAWDFWPAKGFVRDAIRDESKRHGTTIYCDWTGAFREAFRLRRGMSNVVLVSKDGRVAFAAEGAIPAAQRRRLITLLRAEVEGGGS